MGPSELEVLGVWILGCRMVYCWGFILLCKLIHSKKK